MLNFKKKKDFEMKQILNFFKYLYKIFMKTISKINDPLYLFHFKSG